MTLLDFLCFLPCLVAKTEVGALSKTLWPALQGGKHTACHPVHLSLVGTRLQHFQSALEHPKAPHTIGTWLLDCGHNLMEKLDLWSHLGCNCYSDWVWLHELKHAPASRRYATVFMLITNYAIFIASYKDQWKAYTYNNEIYKQEKKDNLLTDWLA